MGSFTLAGSAAALLCGLLPERLVGLLPGIGATQAEVVQRAFIQPIERSALAGKLYRPPQPGPDLPQTRGDARNTRGTLGRISVSYELSHGASPSPEGMAQVWKLA